MAKVNFYLKNNQSKISTICQEETLIILYFRYDGNRLQYSTGENILPKFWNNETQRVKKNSKGSFEINNLLDSIEQEIKKIYREAIIENKNISNKYLLNMLHSKNNPIIKQEKTFLGYFDEFIEVQKPTKSPRTIQKYKTLKNQLVDFQSKKHFLISFEKIDPKFYELLSSYYIEGLKLLNNSTSKYIKTLKTFLTWATERGVNKNIAYQKFKAQEKDADIIYLTEVELFKIYNLNLSNNLKLNNIRDTFCFQCFTGLRYSDIKKLQKENFEKEEIHLVSDKTSERLIIPLNKYALSILIRNNYILPVISNQKTNLFLKELGREAELFETVILTQFRGAKEIQVKKMKYEFLTSHTARRTFVTLSLEKGMRPEIVMNITGHKVYATFKKYIKLTSKTTLNEMKNIWNN